MQRLLIACLSWLTDDSLADAMAGDFEELRSRKPGQNGVAPSLRQSLALAGLICGVLFFRLRRALTERRRNGSLMDSFSSNLRHASRSLTRRPGAVAGTLVVLTLGIGLSAVMFALADPFVLRVLPYSAPDELVAISVSPTRQTSIPIPKLSEWQARRDLFVDLAAYLTEPTVRLRTPDGGAVLRMTAVTDNFFSVLGVRFSPPPTWTPTQSSATNVDVPILVAANLPVALATSAVGDNWVGRAFDRQDGGAVRIVGQLPASFLFPKPNSKVVIDAVRVFEPHDVVEDIKRSPTGSSFSSSPLSLIARLQPGVTLAQVEAALMPASADHRAVTISVALLAEQMTASVRPLATGALVAGLLILLLCAANVANLQLAHGIYRRRDIATREALGATRLDIAGLILAEFGILTAVGTGIGLLVTRIVLRITVHVIPAEYSGLGSPALTGRVVTFALAAGVLVMLAGLVPSWIAWRTAPGALFNRTTARDTRAVRALRFAMAASQSAVAILLLTGAVLLGRSYFTLVTQHTGFGATSAAVSVSYPEQVKGASLQSDIEATVDRLRRLPGVLVAAATTGGLVDDMRSGGGGMRIRGTMVPPFNRKTVTPRYLEAIGSRVISGRAFAPDDRGFESLIVNESFARRYFPDAPAVGQVVTMGVTTATIVGVAADTFDIALDTPPEPTVFVPLDKPAVGYRITYVLRLDDTRLQLADLIRREVGAVNRDAVVVDGSSLRDRLLESVRRRSFATLVLVCFAVAALGVTSAGLIGIVTFVVARRTREIAIRLALGATTGQVRRVVMGEAVGAASAGVAAGVILGRWLSRALESLLYGVTPGDWTMTLAAGLFMLVIVLFSSWLPSRRAQRLSPTIALRAE